VVLALAASCAKQIPPPTVTTLAHPEFVYLQVPPALAVSPGASRVDVGWRYLQVNDLKNAALEFSVALKLGPKLYPARTGQGYIAMLMKDYARALTAFDAALELESSYVPALVGRGQALLATDRSELALAAFEKAVAIDPSLTDLSRRIEVLRFRNVQNVIDAAQTAAREGRTGDARNAYERAIAITPESAFLHRELGSSNGVREMPTGRSNICEGRSSSTALTRWRWSRPESCSRHAATHLAQRTLTAKRRRSTPV
jgi:tetratricopeptide (TPR) repeat protein